MPIKKKGEKNMNKILASLLMIGLVLGVAGAGTWAIFSDDASSTGNTFTAGTLDISTGIVTKSVGFDNIQPGDTVDITIPVDNVGSLPLKYTISTSISGTMTGGLYDPVVSDITVNGASYVAPQLLDNGDTDTVVISVTLPLDAGNNYQGTTGILDVVFSAVQQ